MRPYSPGGLLNTLASAVLASEPPQPSRHRLRRGLPGYLIPFAPHAFVSQRQVRPSAPTSPPAFLLISTHSTAPPRVLRTPTCLKKPSSSSNSSVKPRDFTKTLKLPPTHALSPVIPNNACHLRLTAAAGTKLAVTSSGFDQCTEAHFRPPDSSLHPEGLPPTRGVAGSSFRSLPNIRYCSPPWRSGQCLSPDVAGQPLSPATRQSLGEPLPHQQADRN